MDAKKIFDAVIMRSAFSTRNIKSVLIVLAFFAMYVAAGGKIRTVPISPSSANKFETFGGVVAKTANEERPAATAKTVPAESSRDNAPKAAPLSALPARDTTVAKPIPENADSQGGNALNRLSVIQDRLNRQRAKDGK